MQSVTSSRFMLVAGETLCVIIMVPEGQNWFGLVWFGLCCLMTPGLSKDIRCHV